MHALVLVLNKTEYMEEVLNTLVEIGVKGATILDSHGMGSEILSHHYASSTLFGSLKMSFDREHPYNKTLFTVIEDKELLKKSMTRLEEIIGDMSQPGVGFMFTVPVGEVIGMSQLGIKDSK